MAMQRIGFIDMVLALAALAGSGLAAQAQTVGHYEAVVQITLLSDGGTHQLAQGTVTPGNPLEVKQKAGTFGVPSALDVAVGFEGCGDGQLSVRVTSRTGDANSQSYQQATDEFCASLPATGSGHQRVGLGNGNAVDVTMTGGIGS
ncbi:MAG: hypothetical protein B7W99_02530 [Rhodospirillales bacterium 20-58-10]|nr:MAG: hypothetical protein B7W99_02530 [Rhodospirillales bacterium 20-58-10]